MKKDTKGAVTPEDKDGTRMQRLHTSGALIISTGNAIGQSAASLPFITDSYQSSSPPKMTATKKEVAR